MRWRWYFWFCFRQFNSFLAKTIYLPHVVAAVSRKHLLVNHCSRTLSPKKTSLNTHMEFYLAASGKMTLWEMWWTPKWKPCCDQVHNPLSITPQTWRFSPLHWCLWVREWLFLIIFRCLERAKSHSNEKENKKKLNFPDAPVYSTAYHSANPILPPRDQYLHYYAFIYSNGGGVAKGGCNTTDAVYTIYSPTVSQMYFFCNANKL